MSGKKAKKARRINRLAYVYDFLVWLQDEPPMWRIWARMRWKAQRPAWSGRQQTRSLLLDRTFRELAEECRWFDPSRR